MSASGSKRAIIFAFAGNLLIAAIKYVVAFITGSSAMLAESIHSTADTFNQVLLLVGNKRATKPASEIHSFGYANEVYFWSMMVAMLLFFVGSIFSLYEGIHKLLHPKPITNIEWIYVVIIASIIIEAKSFQVAFGEFRKTTRLPYFRAIKASTQVSLIVVVLEDSAALAGLITVLISTTLAILVHPLFDAVGSILVGLILLAVSILLIAEVKNLIVGESMPRAMRLKMQKILMSYTEVKHINRLQTLVMGDNKYLALISVDMQDDLTAYKVEDLVEKIKLHLQHELPDIGNMYIEIKDSVRNQKT